MNIPYLDLKAVTAQHSSEIHAAVGRVIDSGWYLQGDCTKRFEHNFAQYTGYDHCVGVANGLDALSLTLRAYIEMGIMNEGDEVLVPANTFIATVLAITDNRLKPVFVEPRYDTLEIDDTQVESSISSRTRMLLLVHLYGRCAWTENLYDVCKRHNLIVVEDCAQAHGCKGIGRGDASCYSFYPGKNLGALGDGGAVVTSNEALASMVRTIANYGFSKRYVAPHAGRNSRLDELQAAVLDVKLKYLDADNACRQALARTYYNSICNSNISLPLLMDDGDNVYHIFPILTPHRDALQQHLQNRGIGTIIHYPIPPHKQECYAQWDGLSLPITERITNEELSLPLNQTMTDDEVKYVVEAINSFNLY